MNNKWSLLSLVTALVMVFFVEAAIAKPKQAFGFGSPTVSPITVINQSGTGSATTSQIFGNFGPQVANLYDLGNPYAWKDVYASGTAYFVNANISGTCTGCGGGAGSSGGWTDFNTFLAPTTGTRGVVTFNAVTSTYFAATSTSQVSTFKQISYTDATGTSIYLSGLGNAVKLAWTDATGTSLSVSGLSSLGNLTWTNATGTSLSMSGLSALSTLTWTTATATSLNLSALSGNIFVNGANPRKTLILSGAGGIPALTNGSTAYQFELGATNIYAQGFDATTTKYVSWGPVDMPRCWDGGSLNDVTFEFLTGTSTAASSSVWALQGKVMSTGTVVDSAWGAAIYATGTHTGIANMVFTTSSQSSLTMGGTTNATSTVMFRAYRSAAQSDDDLMTSTTLLSVKMTYGNACLSD